MGVPTEPAAGPGSGGDRTVSQAGERRSAQIESLRALAALSVLLGHVTLRTAAFADVPVSGQGLVSRLLFGGGFGVFLFFGLSGYLLFWPFARRYFGTGESIDLRRYAINRAVRILPLYYVVVLVVLATKHGHVTLGTWARFMTFTENFSSFTAGRFIGPAWSLVVELQFYAVLPLLAVAIAAVAQRSRTRAAACIAALALASLAIRVATMYAADTIEPLWRFNMPTTFLFFTSGMMLALLRLSWEHDRPRWLRGPLANGDAWLLTSVPLWALVILGSYRLGALVWPATFLVIGAVVLPLSQGPVTRSLRWRPLAIVGVASYSLYLWHMPVLEAISSAGLRTTSLLTLGAVAVPISLLVALLSYAIVESPFLRLRRQWSRSSADVERDPRGALERESGAGPRIEGSPAVRVRDA